MCILCVMGTSAGILLAFGSRQRKKYTPTEIGSLSKFYRELLNSTDYTSNRIDIILILWISGIKHRTLNLNWKLAFVLDCQWTKQICFAAWNSRMIYCKMSKNGIKIFSEICCLDVNYSSLINNSHWINSMKQFRFRYFIESELCHIRLQVQSAGLNNSR